MEHTALDVPREIATGSEGGQRTWTTFETVSDQKRQQVQKCLEGVTRGVRKKYFLFEYVLVILMLAVYIDIAVASAAFATRHRAIIIITTTSTATNTNLTQTPAL
jgi:hypothetical protein